MPQILPNGAEGITAFSGVFQATVNLPFLYSVTIDSTSYAVNNSFQQYYNHYHCAVLPIYSASKNEMHSVFFGSIAQYFDSAEVKVSLYRIAGKKIEEKTLSNLSLGENTYHRKIKNFELGGTYIFTIETLYEKATQKIIIQP